MQLLIISTAFIMPKSNLNLISKFGLLIANKILDSLKLPLILSLINRFGTYSLFILESNE
jgi:hypothetical protein